MDARKVRYGPEDLEQLFSDADRLLVARGRKVVEIPADGEEEERNRLVLGRSGNLRAPVARVGRTYLVGFHPEAWTSVLG